MLAEKINKARAAGLSDDEIASFISEKDQDFAGKFSKSREAGLSSSEVLNFIAGAPDRSSPVDPSYLAQQFAGGLGKGVQGYANTAEKLGVGGDATKAADAFGKAIASRQTESATDRFLNPKQGDTTVLGYGVGSIPGAIAESGAGMLADLGAMAAGTAVGGPVGGIALPMASYGLREYGNELDKRVANNGGAPATGTDQAAAAASILAQSALNRLALGKVGGGAAIGERTLAEGAKRVGGAIGSEAATEVGQELTSQIATSAGTQKGLTIDPKELGGAAILGGATGGAFRTAGEAGTQFRNLTDAVNTRGLQFKEEAGNVASEVARIVEENKTRLGDRKGDTNALIDYESRLDVMSQAPTKRAVAELDSMLAKGDLSQADHAKAKAALTERANPEGFSIAERAIGGMGEGADAIAFAKRKAIVQQLKEEGGYSRDGVIKGGLTAKGERLLSEAKSTLTAAGLGGGLAYAGYKGLGTFGATVASIQSALPAAYALGGAYLGAKALDTTLGTTSPVAQVVRRFGQKDNPINSPSADLPTWADLDQQEQQRKADLKARADFARMMDNRMKAQNANEKLMSKQDAEAQKLIKRTDKEDAATAKAQAKEQAKNAIGVRKILEDRRKATAFNEQAFVDRVDTKATNQLIAETNTNMTNERKAAQLAMNLAQMQQKLDLARGVVKPASEYEGISQIRAEPQYLQSLLDKVTIESKAAGIENKANKAAKAGTKANPEPKAEKPKAGSKKAQAQAPDQPVLSGPTRAASDTPAKPVDDMPKKGAEPTPEQIATRREKLIQQRRENYVSFETLIKGKFPDVADAIIKRLNVLDGRENNAGKGMKQLNKIPKDFGEAGQYVKDWWINPDQKLQNTRLGRTFYSRKLGKVLMTAKEAEKSRGF